MICQLVLIGANRCTKGNRHSLLARPNLLRFSRRVWCAWEINVDTPPGVLGTNPSGKSPTGNPVLLSHLYIRSLTWSLGDNDPHRFLISRRNAAFLYQTFAPIIFPSSPHPHPHRVRCSTAQCTVCEHHPWQQLFPFFALHHAGVTLRLRALCGRGVNFHICGALLFQKFSPQIFPSSLLPFFLAHIAVLRAFYQPTPIFDLHCSSDSKQCPST